MRYYLGVDIGTSGCKAAIFDETGKPAVLAYREYDLISPRPGWAELDSDEVIEKCFAAIKEAAGQVPAHSVRGLGISSQGEAFTPVDKNGKALANACVSSDTRAVEYVAKWPREFGEQRLYRKTGHTSHPLFSLFKLLWLRDQRPEIWLQTDKFLCFEDLLQFRLGLSPSMGWPLAGRTMLFDVVKHQWDADILAAVGIRPEQLAKPLPSGAIAGTIPERIATKLNLGPNTFVVTGGHDQPCSALGAGVIDAGVAVYATGTVECITPAFSRPVFSDNLYRHNLCTYDHTVPDMYVTVAFSLTGGNILKWYRDEFGAAETAKAKELNRNVYALLLGQMPEQPSGLLVLPYFTPTGTPYFDTEVSGAILGLKLTTKRQEILKALLEGVAFEMRLNLELLQQSGCEVRELRAIGGGAQSDRWNQLKADVMGKKISVIDVSEAGCKGVAMLAKAADVRESVKNIATQWVSVVSHKTPDPHSARIYSGKFERYKQLYPFMKKFYQ